MVWVWVRVRVGRWVGVQLCVLVAVGMEGEQQHLGQAFGQSHWGQGAGLGNGQQPIVDGLHMGGPTAPPSTHGSSSRPLTPPPSVVSSTRRVQEGGGGARACVPGRPNPSTAGVVKFEKETVLTPPPPPPPLP